jgi:hypothetical protein
MSNVAITDANSQPRKIDTFQRTEGPDIVETQAVAVVNPANGTPIDFATQTTMAALLTAASAIQAAAEALNSKTTAVNTGAVTVSNMVAQGLTNAELRAANVPTSNNATVFLFSTNNSSTIQLAAGATFTGVIETALDQPSISLLLTSDQDMIVTIRQFIDLAGIRAAPNIVIPVAAGAGLARSLPLNGNYVQVLAQNVGASTTTTFNINTAYGDMLPADSSGALPTTELPLVISGQAAQTAVVNNILTTTAGAAPIDVSGYRAASVQVVSTGTGGTFIFEQSNNGTDWAALPVFNAALVTGVPITAAITATASAIVYSFAIRCSFVRLRIATTITGGSIRVFSRFSTDSWTPSVALVASNTAANMQVTATVTGDTAAAASADALANPTIKQIGADLMNWNGASWDRQRANVNVTMGDTGAKTASFAGATQTNFNARGAKILAVVPTVSGTSPTLTAQLQVSPDGGTTWLNYGPASAALTAAGTILFDVYPTNESVAGATPAALTTNATQTVQINGALPRTWRLNYTITGTTPSFTFTNAYAAYTN